MYPQLEINLEKIIQNAHYIIKLCREFNIEVAGVVKGCNNMPEVVEVFVEAGCKWIADSRINRFTGLKSVNKDIPLMLLRIPMAEEVSEVIKYADISLNSEFETIKLLNEEAGNQNKVHGVILMIDVGDLREGIFPPEKAVDFSQQIEDMKYIDLKGIGTNLSCYGGVVPDKENLGRVTKLAKRIERLLNRKLEIVSGGATTSIPLLLDKEMPVGINNLRIGESILLGRDIEELWGYDMSETHKDTFVLKAQVIEVKEKPSVPIGTIHVDAFGQKPKFAEKGKRRRAIVAVGKADFVYPDQLISRIEGIEVLGASSDHLILDVTEAEPAIELGDILEFELYYGALLHLTQSQIVSKTFVK
jgi:predicted amino acid racemase